MCFDKIWKALVELYHFARMSQGNTVHNVLKKKRYALF